MDDYLLYISMKNVTQNGKRMAHSWVDVSYNSIPKYHEITCIYAHTFIILISSVELLNNHICPNRTKPADYWHYIYLHSLTDSIQIIFMIMSI